MYIDLTDPEYDHLGEFKEKIPRIRSLLGEGFIIIGGFARDAYDRKENPSVGIARDIDISINKRHFDRLAYQKLQKDLCDIDQGIQIAVKHDDVLDMVRFTYLLHNMFFIPFLDQDALNEKNLIEGHLYTASPDCITALKDRELVVDQHFKDDFDRELAKPGEFSEDFAYYLVTRPRYLRKYASRKYKLSEDTKTYFQTIADRLTERPPLSEVNLRFLKQMFTSLFIAMGVDYRNYLNSPIEHIRETAIKFREDLPALRNAGLVCYESYP